MLTIATFTLEPHDELLKLPGTSERFASTVNAAKHNAARNAGSTIRQSVRRS
jgi:hypothetical protein